MHTPVFLDDLPDISSISSRKSELYRLTRNKALIDLLLDETASWTDRPCPACGQERAKSRNFSQTLLPFQRCTGCNTIYAARIPTQQRLDQMRLENLANRPPEPVDDPAARSQAHDFEFASILNWIRLTDARTEMKLEHVLDFRFCSQAPAWPGATERLGTHRSWSFLPLTPGRGDDFADLRDTLRANTPNAVLLQAEMDRIADPATLLRTIRDNVPPGTLIFVATSCADGLEYDILGAESPSFIPLDRLNIFSVKGFEGMARDIGLKTLEVSTPGRLDAIILQRYFTHIENADVPFWSGFFRDANKDRLRDLQILLQRSLRSGIMRVALET